MNHSSGDEHDRDDEELSLRELFPESLFEFIAERDLELPILAIERLQTEDRKRKGFRETGRLQSRSIRSFDELVAIRDEISNSSRMLDAYFGGGLLARNTVHRTHRGTRDEVRALWVLGLDLDYADANKGFDGFLKAKEAAKRVGGGVLVRTGGGLQLLSCIDPPILVSDENRAEVELLGRKRHAQGCEVSGVTLDPTFDLPRVYRLPGTKNFKRMGSSPRVRLLGACGDPFDLEALKLRELGSSVSIPPSSGLALGKQPGVFHSDDELGAYCDAVARALGESNGDWADYFAAEPEALELRHPSHSEADFFFCCLVLELVGDVPEVADCLLRRSGLRRSKWNEVHSGAGSTYGEMTLQRALAKVQAQRASSHQKREKPLAREDVEKVLGGQEISARGRPKGSHTTATLEEMCDASRRCFTRIFATEEGVVHVEGDFPVAGVPDSRLRQAMPVTDDEVLYLAFEEARRRNRNLKKACDPGAFRSGVRRMATTVRSPHHRVGYSIDTSGRVTRHLDLGAGVFAMIGEGSWEVGTYPESASFTATPYVRSIPLPTHSDESDPVGSILMPKLGLRRGRDQAKTLGWLLLSLCADQPNIMLALCDPRGASAEIALRILVDLVDPRENRQWGPSGCELRREDFHRLIAANYLLALNCHGPGLIASDWTLLAPLANGLHVRSVYRTSALPSS